MNISAKSLSILTAIFVLSTIIISLHSPLLTKQGNPPLYYAYAAPNQKFVDLESDQSFASAAGAVIEYNVYVENTAKSIASYTLSALSDRGYLVEVWREMDQIGTGDIQLIPPQESTLTVGGGEAVTLLVKVTIPPDAIAGTVDKTTIKVVNKISGASDSVAVITTVDTGLPYPSNWIQLGSDPTFPIPPPERIDIKALYYTNNSTHVFFRMAEVDVPNTQAFRYSVFLDTKAGGQQIESYSYDYQLNSDGIMYEWNGLNWVNSGYQTYWQVQGTAIVLWADLNNFGMDTQDIHIFSSITTKGAILKDKLGPYTVPRSSISEIPLILIPVLGLAVYFAISRKAER